MPFFKEKRYCIIFSFMIYVLLRCVIFPNICCAYSQDSHYIQQIQLQKSPYRILITLDQKSSYKIIQLDKKEVIIAFKDVGLSENFKKRGTAKPLIKKIRLEILQNNVTALVINTVKEIGNVNVEWIGGTNVLVVRLYDKRIKRKVRAPLKKKVRSKLKRMYAIGREQQEYNIEEQTLPLVDIRKTRKAARNGNIDDIIKELTADKCSQQEIIRTAIESCQKEHWSDAISVLKNFIETQTSEPCTETATFLMTYSLYKKNIKGETSQYLEIVNRIQDAINYFPESRYIPYAMTILGKIYINFGNPAEAKGYFRIVLDKYSKYSGIPEILFTMGQLEVKKKKYKKAISLYRKILAQYPHYIFISDVRIELGKTLFEVNSFSKALTQLNEVIKQNPRKVYESSDLMLHIGNSYYHIGKYKEARKVLGEVYNLYPGLESAHIVLTRIGDILVDEDQIEKAKKIFNFVTEKYPGTDGFIISSMRIAKYNDNRSEKENIYQVIISEYSEHPMAHLARLRMAEIEYNAGEYEKSISSINDLLVENPRALMREALFLKKESFKSLFKELMDKEKYFNILKLYEKEKASVNRFDQAPELFWLIGKSYYQGYLHAQAAGLLLKSYKNYEDQKKPADLLFSLGLSLQESGKPEDAFIYFNEYIRSYPEEDKIAESFRRLGRIHLAQNKEQKAIANYITALKRSRENSEKADILCEYGRFNLKKRKFKKSTKLLYEAIHLLNETSGEHAVLLSQAYRNLGEAEMHLKSYSKAAQAFASAIEKTKNEEDRVGLSFMLGESYHKSNKPQKAVEVYKGVAASGDAFWGKLAEEKLKGIALSEKLKNT